jgi:hypothetical protein
MSAELANFLRLAQVVLTTLHPDAGGKVAVVIRAESGHRVVLAAPDPQEQVSGPALPALSPVEADIVRCLHDHGQLIAKAIANRLRIPCDSSLRTILANLCERRPPVLVSSREGYRLAGEGRPHDD